MFLYILDTLRMFTPTRIPKPTLRDKFQKAQSMSDDRKSLYAFGISFIVTAVIAVMWFMSSPFSNAIDTQGQTANISSPFETLKEDINQLRESF